MTRGQQESKVARKKQDEKKQRNFTRKRDRQGYETDEHRNLLANLPLNIRGGWPASAL